MSFLPRFRGLVVEMDASLSGVGLLLYERVATGREVVVGAAALSLEDFGCGDDSAWQYAAEFIGATMGLATALALGRSDQSVERRGEQRLRAHMGGD
jgi:hypothetical protein